MNIVYFDTDSLKELNKPIEFIPITENYLRDAFYGGHTHTDYKNWLNKKYGYKESEEV